MCDQGQGAESIRWRPWPCAECARGAAAVDYFVGRHQASGALPHSTPDEFVAAMIARERAWLVDWVECCPHTVEKEEVLSKLDEGSEHIVYLGADGEHVLKLTKAGVYGDYYFLQEGRVHQRCCTPGDYLLRLEMVEMTFGFAAQPIGVTPFGQIVTLQRFVSGDIPSQSEVDAFLRSAGIEPVKQSCWLWRKLDPDGQMDFWIGDARADNFVKTATGIVPIDIRMWGVSRPD